MWVHFALNSPFITLTGLWAFPYLVQGEGLSPGTAAALLAWTVVVFGVSAPLMAQVAARMRRGCAGDLASARRARRPRPCSPPRSAGPAGTRRWRWSR